MREIMIGATTMGFGIAGLFFLRFWRDTRDRLFALFAVSFFLMALNRLGFTYVSSNDDRGDVMYWLRLVAFLIILLAILDKNIGQGHRARR